MSEQEIYIEVMNRRDLADRCRFLDKACAGNEGLRKRVERLIQQSEQLGSFLEKLPHSVVATEDISSGTQEPGSLIGPYKLLEQVGEGGMGVVYVAEQTEPVRRRVALKIIKPGMDTKQVIARFEAERQALAMMDHPNIAKVLDAGTTGESSQLPVASDQSASGTRSLATGHRLLATAARPYFVMELVRGMPFTDYCDKVRLSPRQRLELFVDVCHAIQHAHQKGIIHRDLKPSNILITLHDGKPVVKVIDFGVAKAIGQQLTERTVYTALTQLVGTPLYMSPEQAELSGLDIDTRSDVYSLGVLLYELLTGQTPFDKDRLQSVSFDEMRRMIREDEPLRPSRRFSTLGAAAISTASQHRGVDERRLSRILSGELDWIVMKALEKDRSRRYESASALAADIKRYLSDEPVLACPPSTMYRFQKFARKHRPSLVAAAAIAVCLILGTTVSAWQAVRATTAEAQANANEQKANANAAQAQEKAKEATEQRDEAQRQRDEVRALNEKLQAAQAEQRATLYAAHMVLAQRALDSSNVKRARELLDLQRPKAGQADLRGFEWHYLNRLSAKGDQEVTTVKTDGRTFSFSPDWRRVASVASDNSVKVREVQTGREIFTIQGQSIPVRIVGFSPDGTRLAAGGGGSPTNRGFSIGGGDKAEVKVWDAQTGKEIHAFANLDGSVFALVFSPDGKRLAASAFVPQRGDSGALTVWDVQSGRELWSLKGGDGRTTTLAFSPDGKRLACSGRVLDAESGNQQVTFRGSSGAIASVVFSPDGKRLLGSGDRGSVKTWDAQTGQEQVAIMEHATGVNGVAFSPDGTRFASLIGNKKLKVWDAATGNELLTLEGDSGWFKTVMFSPDGYRLASSGTDGTIRIYDATPLPEKP